MFNDEQRDYMRSLAATPMTERCYCGWYYTRNHGKPQGCPNCPAGVTCADKVARACKHCGSYPPANDLDAAVVHTVKCPERGKS